MSEEARGLLFLAVAVAFIVWDIAGLPIPAALRYLLTGADRSERL